MVDNRLTYAVIGCAIEVHKILGPGLLESIYEEALVWEMRQQGLRVERQVSLPVRYKDQILASPLRIDVLVEGAVIVECKAALTYNKVFEAQALSYLKISGLQCALVINFGEQKLMDGVHRILNGYNAPNTKV